jgi:nucleotide-binding universal stress UspA family protein
MVRFSSILVATDFSPSSKTALTYGRDLARTFGATLHVLHVADDVMASTGADLWGVQFPEVQARVEELARTNVEAILTEDDRQQLGARGVVRSGPAAAAIVDYAEREQIDLIIVGTHGRSGLPRVIVGSVAERVVRTARGPVLVVRHEGSASDEE